MVNQKSAPKVVMPSVRTTGAFKEPGHLTGPGGLVQRGGYSQTRQIHIMSRARPVFPIKSSKVGGSEPKLPKGMD